VAEKERATLLVEIVTAMRDRPRVGCRLAP